MTEWTTARCAEFFRVSRRTVDRWKHRGFPEALPSGRYDAEQVKAWAASVDLYDELMDLPTGRKRIEWSRCNRRITDALV